MSKVTNVGIGAAATAVVVSFLYTIRDMLTPGVVLNIVAITGLLVFCYVISWSFTQAFKPWLRSYLFRRYGSGKRNEGKRERREVFWIRALALLLFAWPMISLGRGIYWPGGFESLVWTALAGGLASPYLRDWFYDHVFQRFNDWVDGARLKRDADGEVVGVKPSARDETIYFRDKNLPAADQPAGCHGAEQPVQADGGDKH